MAELTVSQIHYHCSDAPNDVTAGWKFQPTGEFKLRGELAGPGTHCTTGLLDWRATKQ